MSILERERQFNLPPPPPPEDPDWNFWDREFSPPPGPPIEPYPKSHLLGRVMLEDCVATVEAKFEQDQFLDPAEQDLLTISHEYVYNGYDEERFIYE